MKLVSDTTRARQLLDGDSPKARRRQARSEPEQEQGLQTIDEADLPVPVVVINSWTDAKQVGRPGKLTRELIEALGDHVAENGSYVEDTCLVFGISRSAFYNWKKRGEEDREQGRHTLYAEFVDTLEKVDAYVRTRISRESFTGGNKWVPMMTLGERRFPEKFGRRSEASDTPKVIVQIGVRDGDVQVQLAQPAAKQIPTDNPPIP